MNTRLLFTVNLNAHDNPHPARISSGWDYLAITDYKTEYQYPWRVERLELRGGEDPRRVARKLKILGRDYFSNYETVVFCDGIFQPYGNLNQFIEDKTSGTWFTFHPQRTDVWREGETIRKKGLDDEQVVLNQLRRYRSEGFSGQMSLYRSWVYIKNRGDEPLFEKWFEEIEQGSKRDQLSLPYASWKSGIPINQFPHGHVEQYFKPHLHKTHELKGGIVRLPEDVSPDDIYAVDKDKWVVLGDFEKAEMAIAKYPLTYFIRGVDGCALPRWLYNYITFIKDMEKYLTVYGADYVWFDEN